MTEPRPDTGGNTDRSERWLALVPFGALITSYLPFLGHGFIKDDFAWIRDSREPAGAWAALFEAHQGFYRPLVSLSFGLNHALGGLEPLGYGLGNLLLVLASMLTLAALVRALGATRGMAWAAAGLWALNPHGIGGAILWISGRTSLLLCLCALLAALALARGRLAWAALALFLALLSKEEATLLPLVLVAWAGLLGSHVAGARFDLRRAASAGLVLLVPWLAYLGLRMHTDAFLPDTAPPYYRPTLAPLALVRNLLEYSDRALTFTLAAVLVAALLAWRRPRLDPPGRRLAALGLLWLAGGFGLTVFLPVRSSLYVPLPSIGMALLGAGLLRALWEAADTAGRRRLRLGALLLPLAIVPLHWSRSTRLERTARLSARTLEAVIELRGELAAGGSLVLHDEPDSRINLRAAFGTLGPAAVELATGLAPIDVWIEPPPPHWQAAGLRQPAKPGALELRLQGQRLLRQ